MKKRVLINGGGFHGVSRIEFLCETTQIAGKPYAVLNERQYKRLQKHFCGMRDCKCYSCPTPHPDSLIGEYWILINWG